MTCSRERSEGVDDERKVFEKTVMPVWVAGIHQVCTMHPGDIHVNLGSSAPCLERRIEGYLIDMVRSNVFSKELARARVQSYDYTDIRVLRVHRGNAHFLLCVA